MVEILDGLEMLENEREIFCKYSIFEKFSKVLFDIVFVGKQLFLVVVGSVILVINFGKVIVSEKEEVKLDDLEWVFQQSIEIGFLDGSC